jgi:hypothetical protein
MWEPRRLTTLWAFTACYRDNFNFFYLYLSGHHDWVSRQGFSVKGPGRNAVLPADAEKQLHHRIVCIQVGFGFTLSYIHRLDVQIFKELSMQNPWKGRVVEKV